MSRGSWRTGLPFGGPVDPDTLLKRSSLPGLKQTSAKIMFVTADSSTRASTDR